MEAAMEEGFSLVYGLREGTVHYVREGVLAEREEAGLTASLVRKQRMDGALAQGTRP